MNKKDAALFFEIKGFIDANLNKNITINDMCERFIVNRTKLQSGFQELFFTSVYSYIVRQRMDLAARRILDTDDAIKVIAMDCGYTRQRSFTKAFKSIFFDSPVDYRRKYRNVESRPSSVNSEPIRF